MEVGDTVFFFIEGFGEMEGELLGWNHETKDVIVRAVVDGDEWEVDPKKIREE